jgi:hypothetical protein
MSNVIPLEPPKEHDPKCSFCGTPKSKAEKFISNGEGTKHICGACIIKAKQRLEKAS